jgi:hypothetical protein
LLDEEGRVAMTPSDTAHRNHDELAALTAGQALCEYRVVLGARPR